MFNDNLYPIYRDSAYGRKKLNLVLSRQFLEQSKQILNPNYHNIRYYVSADIKSFLIGIFKDDATLIYKDKDKGILFLDYEERIFEKINQEGLFINELDYDKIKRNLCGMLKEYFIDEFCFLISFYSWMIPLEKQIKYDEDLESKRKFVEDVEWIVSGKARLHPFIGLDSGTLQYYEQLKKSHRIEKIQRELKSTKTTNEEKNLALLQKRIFEELYGYIKYGINPSGSSFFLPTSLVGKYAKQHEVSTEEALYEILFLKTKNKKNYSLTLKGNYLFRLVKYFHY